MKIGDLVSHSGDKWLVRSSDKMTRTVVICNQKGDKKEVPVDMDLHTPDLLQVICNPGLQWNVLAVKVKSNAGPFTKAEAPTSTKLRPLANWVDWIPSDPFREGGSVFINPKFGLRTGDLVLLTHRNGSQSRMVVPGNFGTVARMKAAKAPIKKPEVTRFTHILDDDD
jgi:hypothetical protein